MDNYEKELAKKRFVELNGFDPDQEPKWYFWLYCLKSLLKIPYWIIVCLFLLWALGYLISNSWEESPLLGILCALFLLPIIIWIKNDPRVNPKEESTAESAMRNTLIRVIRYASEKKGLTHEELAELSGISRSLVTGILSDNTRKATFDRVGRLADALGLSVEISVEAFKLGNRLEEFVNHEQK